jgi:hypothetical protein
MAEIKRRILSTLAALEAIDADSVATEHEGWKDSGPAEKEVLAPVRENAVFFAMPVYTKGHLLPRQARDKHRQSTHAQELAFWCRCVILTRRSCCACTTTQW